MGKIIVVGGGAAGMIAAGRAGSRGHEVHLFEKNNRLGKKLLITGKGRCNLTNDCDVETLLENIPGNPYFMYSAFYHLDSKETQALFHRLGLETKVERGRRVFPVSDKALDVVFALEEYLRENKVKQHLDSPVEELLIRDGRAVGVRLKKGTVVEADAVIVATGGLSYPATGSTGDGYRFAKNAGHQVTKLYPSLVGLKAGEEWCKSLMGLSLRNISIHIKNKKGKTVFEEFGEMLFTHYGVSGPVILSASRHLILSMDEGYKLFIDLKPAMDEKKLDLRLLRDFEKYTNRDFCNALEDLLPKKLIPVIVALSGIAADKKVNNVTKEERKRLLSLLKGLPLTITGTAGFNEAVITCGGIYVDEIDPSTMESKFVKNLHFAGEVLDVDAYTGGYNLQIAFSSGFTAGEGVLSQ
ncbi:ferredoxin--NADP reductase [Anaerotignum neopropionicum]|uniref:Ferredoxin--NADP reductase n=1 Tax=Anaerotignum neopropionicum TaxID=36847 RepID=A0A136WDH2_9FIRM|nr:NAD(P)/FAD-dependent oxidoreductase [Anaerotignum neopropionicum]KXL52558.1 ferredoxin--NADP reductase [Anaerotignum neopropionicum]